MDVSGEIMSVSTRILAMLGLGGFIAVVAVPREEDVKFVGLCAGRRVPALRIGVTDAESGALEVQDRFTVPLAELRAAHRGTLQMHLGPVVGG